ncbi:MAG: twitching motility protein PilT [Myxococcota bacterium]|jgi:twitching motility protein PilT
MSLSDLIERAFQQGASDLHLEPGLPPAMRVRGMLRIGGEPLAGALVAAMAQQLATAEQWRSFQERRSLDLSQQVAGVRCRVNIFQTARGVGMAIRLFASFTANLDELNLHPSLRDLTARSHGLVLVCGPTGSGKSSTTAALVQEINRREARHILTIEQPIEYELRPRRSYIRQREVGRDTPSFEQALHDALREDPDVIVVGEMRRPETMRLTLSAAETGHLVFTTVHSATVTEALQRIIASFPPDGQASVCAQLADCLVAVVCQKLVWQPAAGLRVPECEILVNNTATRACIRANSLHRLNGIIETGRADGMWSWDRYRRWLSERDRFHHPTRTDAAPDSAFQPATTIKPTSPPPQRPTRPRKVAPADDGVFVLDGDVEDPQAILDALLSEEERRR